MPGVDLDYTRRHPSPESLARGIAEELNAFSLVTFEEIEVLTAFLLTRSELLSKIQALILAEQAVPKVLIEKLFDGLDESGG